MIGWTILNMLDEQEDKYTGLIWTDKIIKELYKYMYMQNIRNYKNWKFY